MKKSQACSPSGARSSKARSARTSAPRARKASRCGIEAATSDHVAAGRRHVGLAEAGEQRAGQQERGADALGQAGVHLGVGDPVAADRDHVLVAPLSLRAEVHEQLDHRLHVADARHVAQHDLLGRQQRGGECGQRGVLVAGGYERPGEGRSAFDDELLHARVRPGTGIEPAAKGIEGHLTAGSGLRAGYPARCLPSREEAWALVEEWVQSESLRKHLLGVEAAMVAYAAQVGRGRGDLRGHRPAPRPRLRALPGPRHRAPAQGPRAVRAEGLPAGADRRRGGPRHAFSASRARPGWRRRSTRWTSCPASSPPARSCGPPESTA